MVIILYQGDFAILFSVFLGTGVGLLIKYYLDKKYIFSYFVRDFTHDTYVFSLYTFTGIFTTFVFWGFEFGFEYLFHDKLLRYFGGVMGLSIGYLLKYQLDKRFVFTRNY